MRIDEARKTADKFLRDNLIHTKGLRPKPDERVMARYPLNTGRLYTASDAIELREKLARRIQALSRK